MEESEFHKELNNESNQFAANRARERSRIARWDLDVAIFLFLVLIIVIILLFQGIGTGVVAPIALFGLCMVWLIGWRRGRQLYKVFYEEELAELEKELGINEKRVEAAIEETVEERVQKALRERWK
ncbi:hypothetical protein ACFLUO_09665 [Chloroflexota bacterium]